MANYDGWVNHPQGSDNWGTAPSMSALYYFGISDDEVGAMNYKFSQTIHSIEQHGVYSNSLEPGKQPMDNIGGRFGLVNMLPFYWVLGKATDSSGTKTITHMDGTARKPRIATFTQTEDLKYQSLGNVISDLTLEWDVNNNILMAQVAMMGQSHGISTASPTYSYPSSVNTMFNHFSMTWNGGTVYPLKFRCQIGQKLKGFINSTTKQYSYISEFSPVSAVYSVQFIPLYGESIFDDWVNQTKRTLVWRMDKAENDHYFTVTNDVYITAVDVNRDLNFPIYTMSLMAEDITVSGVDGVANSFYGL